MVDEYLKKAQAEKAYYDQAINQAATANNLGGAMCGEYRPSLAVEAERRAHNAYQEAEKAQAASAFLRQHPEFDEFIQLIRKGAIGI